MIQMLTTAHPAGDAPLPWQSPCVFIERVELAKSVESPKPVRRKNFISWMVVSMDSEAERGTPNAWNTSEAIA